MAPQYETETVVGVFSDYNSARNAARELTNKGVPESAIDIHSDRRPAADDWRNRHEESGISGWFHRTFGDDSSDDAGRYREAVDTGRTIVSVSVSPEQADRVADILNKYGAVDNDPVENRRDDRFTAQRGNQTTAIPVVEEQLEIGKRVVSRGGVRIYSSIVQQPVSEQVNLREEHVRVERRPVDRALTPEEASRLKDQTIEITETVEEPVIGKRARVREEVVVGKETTQRTETVKDNVRRTEVRVEQLGRTDEPNLERDRRDV